MSRPQRANHSQLPRLFTKFGSPPEKCEILSYLPVRRPHHQHHPRYQSPVAATSRDLPTPLRISRPVSYVYASSLASMRHPPEAQRHSTSKYTATAAQPRWMEKGSYIAFKPKVEAVTALVQASIDEIAHSRPRKYDGADADREEGEGAEIAVMHASPGGDYLATPLCFRRSSSSSSSSYSSWQMVRDDGDASPEQRRPASAPPTPCSAAVMASTDNSLFNQIRRSLTFGDDVWAEFSNDDDECRDDDDHEYTDEFEEIAEVYRDPLLGRIRIGTIRR